VKVRALCVDGERATGVHCERDTAFHSASQGRFSGSISPGGRRRRISAPARPLPPPLLNLPHHRSRTLVFILDRFYHIVRWFVVAILIGAIAYGAIGAFLVTGQSGVANPLTWPSIQFVIAYPEWSLGIGVPLLLLTGLGLIAHLTGLAHPQRVVPVPTTDGLTTIPVRSLRLGDFKLGPNPNPAYFKRAVFTQAREMIRAVIGGTASGRIGFVVFGAPMVGKTRLALEALRREAGDFQLLIWPRAGATLSPNALARFQGQRVALLLDDLQEFTRQNEAGCILDAVTKLRGICKPLLVVATSRADSDQDAVTRDFGGLIELLTRLEMQPMVRGSGEADGFLETMREAGAELHTSSFDGTPGSALLDLDRRTDQLRDPSFPRAALATLKAMALLRRAQTYDYPEERVRRVAVGVSGLGEGRSA